MKNLNVFILSIVFGYNYLIFYVLKLIKYVIVIKLELKKMLKNVFIKYFQKIKNY